MAARAFKTFGEKQEDSTGGGCDNINNESEVIQALRMKSISPWSWKFFELVRLKAEKVGGGAPVMMHNWLTLVSTAFPGCLLNFACESFALQ